MVNSEDATLSPHPVIDKDRLDSNWSLRRKGHMVPVDVCVTKLRFIAWNAQDVLLAANFVQRERGGPINRLRRPA